MFAKLLKQEWRATRNVVGLLCVLILLSGVFIGLSTGYLSGRVDSTLQWLETVCVLVTMVCFLVVGVSCAAGLIYLVYHYYESRFTDQGYLTFTLPVTGHQLLLSGIVNILLGTVLVLLSAVVAMAAALGLMLLSLPLEWGRILEETRYLWQTLRPILVECGADFMKLLVTGVIYGLSQLVLLLLAVTVGAIIAKKHRLLATAGVYCGIGLARSILLCGLLGSSAVTGSITTLVNTTLLLSALLAVGGYFLMYFFTGKRLNLQG